MGEIPNIKHREDINDFTNYPKFLTKIRCSAYFIKLGSV